MLGNGNHVKNPNLRGKAGIRLKSHGSCHGSDMYHFLGDFVVQQVSFERWFAIR